MTERTNFVIVLSPAAVASRWVREEMDAAKALEYEDPEQRIILPVVAQPCEIPLFFRKYKRVSGPGDVGVSAEEAARRVAQELNVHPVPAERQGGAALEPSDTLPHREFASGAA